MFGKLGCTEAAIADNRVSSLDPESTPVFFLFDLAEGDYMVSVFQDSDGDGSMDSEAFGLPMEPVELSGWDGRGVPGGFARHTLRLDAGHTFIQVQLIRLSARRD